MRRLIGVARRRLLATFASKNELASCVNFVYQQCLGRDADPECLRQYTNAMRGGMPFSQVAQEIAASAEAEGRRQELENERADAINLVYQHFLGRDADPECLRQYTNAMRGGMPFSQVAQEIAASAEAEGRRQELENERADAINLVYQHYLGRDADPDSLRHNTSVMRNGTPLSLVAQEIAASAEAEGRRQELEKEHAHAINLVYQHYLGRDVDPDTLRHCITAMLNGMRLSHIAQIVESSAEAEERRRGAGALDDLSDGEFILGIADVLLEHRGAIPADIERWRKFLKEDRTKRDGLIHNLISAHVTRQRRNATPQWDPHHCWIMGTERYLTLPIWQDRAKQLNLAKLCAQPAKPVMASREFKHSGIYVVSAIASLYKGRRFLESFRESITSQTIFDRSELILIDANSPEGEAEIIANYQKIFPNIVYKRINYRVGVYDAWNIGVQLARGKYLTNTNLDDLRRRDLFELQASALDQHTSADVVYQDVFYSFDGSLSFDEIARFDFKSELPIVTPHNLLVFNSPHDAPMWRKSLHEEVGLFDTSFKSAGDWEFWLRCLWKGKSFFKINTPHVTYFQNPENAGAIIPH